MTITTDELVERVARQVATCSDTYEAPNGKIMCRIWIADLAALTKLARAAMPPVATDELVERVVGALAANLDLSVDLLIELQASGNLSETAEAAIAAMPQSSRVEELE
jgi:hypothetical protein